MSHPRSVVPLAGLGGVVPLTHPGGVVMTVGHGSLTPSCPCVWVHSLSLGCQTGWGEQLDQSCDQCGWDENVKGCGWGCVLGSPEWPCLDPPLPHTLAPTQQHAPMEDFEDLCAPMEDLEGFEYQYVQCSLQVWLHGEVVGLP